MEFSTFFNVLNIGQNPLKKQEKKRLVKMGATTSDCS